MSDEPKKSNIQRCTIVSASPITALNAPYTGDWVRYSDHLAEVSRLIAKARGKVLEEAAGVARAAATQCYGKDGYLITKAIYALKSKPEEKLHA